VHCGDILSEDDGANMKTCYDPPVSLTADLWTPKSKEVTTQERRKRKRPGKKKQREENRIRNGCGFTTTTAR
jgi:hypothetical protein